MAAFHDYSEEKYIKCSIAESGINQTIYMDSDNKK
jgi:hypothetical protein